MDAKIVRALIIPGKKNAKDIEVLFNPNEYSFESSNSYKTTQVPGLRTPLLQFVNGECDTLSMELFLDDATDPKGAGSRPAGFVPASVQERLQALFDLMKVEKDLHAPPPVTFRWGTLIFKAVIEKMSRKVTLFTAGGVPERATVTVTFKEYRTIAEQVDDPKLHSSDKSKRRQIVGLDTIYLLAFREYQDITRWREIAIANDLDDPRDVAAGDFLVLPPLEDDDGSRDRF